MTNSSFFKNSPSLCFTDSKKMKMTHFFHLVSSTFFAHLIFIDPPCAEHSIPQWFLAIVLNSQLRTKNEAILIMDFN